MFGLKLVILGSTLMAAIISHYGYPPLVWDWNPLEWYRHDIPVMANIGLYMAAIAVTWGLQRAD